jgi:curved DNA-binding protein CbpA
MAAPGGDPYEILGVGPEISDDELRTAYHRLVQIHHPDHNNGSVESARRFEEIQRAYAQIREQRDKAPRPDGPPPHVSVDPDVDARLAELERELREANAARERARRAAREAAAAASHRPSDEELGYVTTDDSLTKILADARTEMSDRLAQAREHPVGKRVAELIDELSANLTGDPPRHRRD